MRIPTKTIWSNGRQKIVNADDPRECEGAPAAAVTRESIADMPKADVIELIEAHGVDPDGRWSVDRLRAQLVAIMFVDA